jgi:hypothetical protein
MDTALMAPPASAPMHQWQKALQRANEVRLRRVAEGRKIEAASTEHAKVLLAELVLSCPSWLESEPIGRWLEWLPRYGPSRIQKLLKARKISELRQVGALTVRQRQEVAGALGVKLSEERSRELLGVQAIVPAVLGSGGER